MTWTRHNGVFVPSRGLSRPDRRCNLGGAFIGAAAASMRRAAGAVLTIVDCQKKSGTPFAVTVSVDAGTFLVAVFSSYGTTPASQTIADNKSNTWTKAVGIENADAGAYCNLSVWVLPSAQADLTTITASGGSYGVLIVHAVTGATVFTATEYTSLSGGATASTNPQTTSLSFASPSVLFAAINNNKSSGTATFTPNSTGSTGGTWAYFSASAVETNANSYMPTSVASVVIPSGGTAVHGWTTDNQLYCNACLAIH